jgi:hypothetical protein
MKLTLTCPHASYDATMRIVCAKDGGKLCGNQRFRPCKGWYVLTDWAKDCTLRQETPAAAPKKKATKAKGK